MSFCGDRGQVETDKGEKSHVKQSLSYCSGESLYVCVIIFFFALKFIKMRAGRKIGHMSCTNVLVHIFLNHLLSSSRTLYQIDLPGGDFEIEQISLNKLPIKP